MREARIARARHSRETRHINAWVPEVQRKAIEKERARQKPKVQKRPPLNFTPAEKLKWKLFFWFKKEWIWRGWWAELSKAGKGAFPVIASHCNVESRRKQAFPSMRTIAHEAGRSEMNVNQAIKDLENEWGGGIFKVQHKAIKNERSGQWSNLYILDIPKRNNQDCFPFPLAIIQSGVWAKLKPTAQALYPVMKAMAVFNLDHYLEEESEELETVISHENDFWNEEYYSRRKYDFCWLKKNGLAELAGIHPTNINGALKNLEDNGLIENDSMCVDTDDGEGRLQYIGWKVFKKPV